MKLHNGDSAFCEVYGYTLTNRVWSFLLAHSPLEFSISDLPQDMTISKPKAYEIIEEFEKKGYVTKSRVKGKTQLYKLNLQNKIVQIHHRNFMECLRMVIERYEEKTNDSIYEPKGVLLAKDKPSKSKKTNS
jgi:sugar-specific transcriptional regulator TrmB